MKKTKTILALVAVLVLLLGLGTFGMTTGIQLNQANTPTSATQVAQDIPTITVTHIKIQIGPNLIDRFIFKFSPSISDLKPGTAGVEIFVDGEFIGIMPDDYNYLVSLGWWWQGYWKGRELFHWIHAPVGMNVNRIIFHAFVENYAGNVGELWYPYQPTPNICDMLEELGQAVDESPNDAWREPADNRKQAMLEKIDEAIILCEAEVYQELYDKLLHDIKPKLTGLKTDENEEPWGNGIFNNPWVTNNDLQEAFQLACNELLNCLVAT